MGGGFGGGNNGNPASGIHARAASNGADDFNDFQGSTPVAGAGGGDGVTNGGTNAAAAAAAVAAAGSVSNPKWRDVSSLVDLGGLSSNTDKKVGGVDCWKGGGSGYSATRVSLVPGCFLGSCGIGWRSCLHVWGRQVASIR